MLCQSSMNDAKSKISDLKMLLGADMCRDC
jgi:hypothetical protein